MTPHLWLLLTACLSCACGNASDEPPVSGGSPYISIDDLPECDPETPGYACLKQLFLPLAEHDWPFEAKAVGRAQVPGGVFVLPEGKLTALHVIDAELQQDPDVASHPPDCYAGQATFSKPGEVIVKENCADFLFLGGSPTAVECQRNGITIWECTDLVDVSGSFDIGLVHATAGAGRLETSDAVEVDEEVFLVGDPSFLLAAGDDGDQVSRWFDGRYPLVSSGKVLAVEGGGILVSNLAFPGNSGGPLLNRAGQVLGVASTKVGDLRASGVEIDPKLPNHRTVITRVTTAMKERIEAELALKR